MGSPPRSEGGTGDGKVIKRTAEISDCGKYRYSLGRKWSEGGKRICWIMLNPSTADAEVDDPTLKRCIHFSQSWGYDELVVVNLLPYRSPSPWQCREWLRRNLQYGPVRQVNGHAITNATATSWKVVAAWGSYPWSKGVQAEVMTLLRSQQGPDFTPGCIGTTKHGDPKHPMARGKHRVPDNQQLVHWECS